MAGLIASGIGLGLGAVGGISVRSKPHIQHSMFESSEMHAGVLLYALPHLSACSFHLGPIFLPTSRSTYRSCRDTIVCGYGTLHGPERGQQHHM